MATEREDDGLTPLGQSLGESLSVARHLLLVVAPLGLVVGAAIAAYDWVVNELLWKRFAELGIPARLALPALGMLLTGLVLHWFRVRSSAMADEVVKAYHDPESGIPMDTAGAKLVASVATMGFGGSAGMEGASKWLGATIGTLVQGRLNALKLRAFHWDRRTTLLAGGAAGIAAIFRAPLSGAIMGIESPYKHDLALDALAPGLVASATSFWIFSRLRPGSPYFPIRFHYELSTRDMLVAVPLGVSAGLASHLFLATLRRIRKRFGDMPFPIYVRTGIGGVALVAIAYAAYRAVGSPVTLQAGLPVANRLLNGQYVLWACLVIFSLKLLATAVTFGSGGVGGLFVPTATIGAALGACWDALLSHGHPGVYTILGIAGFSAASYNSLLFSAVFVAEATGNVFLVAPALIASTVAFLVSAGVSNSHAQRKKRPGLDEKLGTVPLERIMTRRIVTTSPDVTLESFAHSVLVGHQFKALPVIDERGIFQGMVGLAQLRRVPMVEWKRAVVLELLDARVPTLCPHHSAADAERLLGGGTADYVPIVDPGSYRLVGIVSRSDLYRARGQATAERAA